MVDQRTPVRVITENVWVLELGYDREGGSTLSNNHQDLLIEVSHLSSGLH